MVAGCGGCGVVWFGFGGAGMVLVGSDDGGVPGRVIQSGVASGEALVYQAGRDLTVRSGPVVPMMESVPVVAGVGRIPVGSGVFVGRAVELERLDAAVAESGRAVVVAVHGLGGVGKSTLAARFAELRAERFSLVWWVTADSAAAVDEGLAELAVAVAPEVAGLPLEQRTELGVRWLSTRDDWLLVLDNLTGPVDAVGLLERVRTGTVVVTSRQAVGWRMVRTVLLDVLSPDEATELLARIVRAEWPEADLAGAGALCAELGLLPLAVEQAAAYLAQARITPGAYLGLLAGFPARMFAATAEGGDTQRTVARVWRVTLDRLADTPHAGRLLRLLAWYASDAVPRAVLARGVGEPDLSEALGRLAAYSMITHTVDAVSVHRLVQAVTRIPDPTDPHRQPDDIADSRDTATTILSDIVAALDPCSPADWPRHRLILPHARALLDHTTSDTDNYQTCRLLHELGIYLQEQGEAGTAITYHTRATTTLEHLHGSDHPNTLTSRNNLAHAYQAAGSLSRAIPLCEATLADRERVWGSDHPHTLNSRNNLAGVYESAGDPRRAIPLYETTLADRERVLGSDHPHTLNSRNNLAGVYESAGDPRRAIPLYETTLADRERVLGSDHPHTLISRNNLAYAYRVVGDLNRAIPLYQATLVEAERVLGREHPYTLTVRNNLAIAFWAAGDPGQAVSVFEVALTDSERILGLEHPTTTAIRANLDNARST
ncbi:tetratricopeptide repeat protein [Actinosynnema sp. NPDC023587]|uniref:tetratricopeptide repeat protein n=1 Tax=Actinosynnema sp. NPDC023587 TaxID=3154695 RepID=UPI0033C6373B